MRKMADDLVELLFFDTFSHETNKDLNLDLIQFPKPVYITEIRIIPLGAKVQADFPGGVRLGATNPSEFDIEFFVNDFGKPGASTFEKFGNFKYHEEERIHLECKNDKILTDGLVLRGWYTTITLAVYGTLTKNLTEQIASPQSSVEVINVDEPTNIVSPQQIVALNENSIKDARDAGAIDWREEIIINDPVVSAVVPEIIPLERETTFVEPIIEDTFESGLIVVPQPQPQSCVGVNITGSGSTASSIPVDDYYPTNCHIESSSTPSSMREYEKRPRKKSHSSERSSSRNRTYSHSDSNDREYSRQKRDRSRSPTTEQYSRHSRRVRRDERSREMSEISERDRNKWPRTPPLNSRESSPRRPPPRSPERQISFSDNEDNSTDDGGKYHSSKPIIKKIEQVPPPTSPSPQQQQILSSQSVGSRTSDQDDDQLPEVQSTETPENNKDTSLQLIDEDSLSQDEQYEPILSDDEICDEQDNPDEQDNDDIELDDDFEDAIKVFDPFKMTVNKFIGNDIDGNDIYDVKADINDLEKILRKYEMLTEIKSPSKFICSSTDEKENFVHISEQLITRLTQTSTTNLKNKERLLEKFLKRHSNKNDFQLIANVLKIAVNFECAFEQPRPAYKIRHIKVGARSAELLAQNLEIFNYLIDCEKFNPFESLFDLYDREYMALSIKLTILKAIYSLLDTKRGVEIFLTSQGESHEFNGYQRLLCMLEKDPLTRIKFSLRSIIKKLNVYEGLKNIQDIVSKFFIINCHKDGEKAEPLNEMDLEFSMKEVINALNEDALSYQQPKRLLPVSKKFEVVKDLAAYKSWSYMMQNYFRIHTLAESLLLVISNKNSLSLSLLNCAYDVIENLLNSPIGIDYLVEDCFETTELLVKTLLGIENDSVNNSPGGTGNEELLQKSVVIDDEIIIERKSVKEFKNVCRPELRSQKLGIEMAFKVQTRYHLDAIKRIKDNPDTLVEHLHSLYSQTCTGNGRQHTVNIVGLPDNVKSLLNLVDKEKKIQTQRQQDTPGFKYKSPVLSYSVDLLDSCVRHCNNLDYMLEHGQALLDLVKDHEIFEPSVSAVLQEMAVYLKPIETIGNFSTYCDVVPLCEVIKRSTEYLTTFPGDLIMGLRILKYLGIQNPHYNRNAETREIKNLYVILQLFSADGVITLVNILEKLNNYFEQPGLHSPILMTIQAVHTCQIILPALQILREMITYVIQCRDTQFKDLTAIEHLLKTYCLMHYFPELSPAFDDSQKIKGEIIATLLAYTQPNHEGEDSVHKSLWTQMIREVIKFTLHGPSTFIPGLQAFAELLPLPLPIPTLQPLSELETQRLITERKLWSAHLHPECGLLAELIQTICPTSFPQLSDLLTRVCLQLADLAPNMTLLISKTVIDMIISECGKCPSGIGSLPLARLLRFLAQLTSYASVKISSLSILPGKLCEYFNQILTSSDSSDAHQLCQDNIHRILENFFDSEISMIAPNTTGSLELNLACALPSKELIPGIINSIFVNLLNANVNSSLAMAASRNLIILSEHDITFYHLRQTLISKKDLYQQWLIKVVNSYNILTSRAVVDTLILFLRTLIYTDESSVDSTVPNRTLKLTIPELAVIINMSMKPEESAQHPLRKLHTFMEKDEEENRNESTLIDLVGLLSAFEDVEIPAANDFTFKSIPEPNLPQAEGIVTQYYARPLFTIYENQDDAQLNANYWLEPIRLDSLSENLLGQSERVPCDLSIIVNMCLPPETNLTSDCKRVLHLSASPQSNRERTTAAPCFRTRRVEVEPNTGRPEKKLYVSPMRGRGFPRAPPSRGDIFRSRPPNTSRPPSLHVDDFLALETCGAQPTGPTGYNKISREIINIRGSRGIIRSRGSRIATVASSGSYRNSSSSTWSHGPVVDPNVPPPPPQHFRTATSEPVVSPHFSTDSRYTQPHFGGGVPIRSRGRGRARTFLR